MEHDVLYGQDIRSNMIGSDLSSFNGMKVSYSLHFYNLDKIFTGDVLLLESFRKHVL
jgi:hypothetical protein